MKFSEALTEYLSLKLLEKHKDRWVHTRGMSDDAYYRRLHRLEDIMDKMVSTVAKPANPSITVVQKCK